MKIFVVNKGSSSIKCALYEFKSQLCEKPIWEGQINWKSDFKNPTLTIKNHSEPLKEKTPSKAFEHLVQSLMQKENIDIIGHRIVHGGPYFNKSVLITSAVKKKIASLRSIAPLHNASELEGIEILEKILKKTPQIAVFDTAFHHTMPEKARIYPGPYEWVDQGIVRYGFHGISFQYCTKRASALLQKRPQKMIICHLGSGASLAAVKNGKSIDTSMGFTPLEGLMMDTRSGSIDPGILLYLSEKKKTLSDELYHKSGLLGISGLSSDMRDIIAFSQKGHARATLALDIYIHRLNANIGAMISSLNGLDALVFTGGIGENATYVRSQVCKAFSFLGITLDSQKNKKTSKDILISKHNSKVSVLVIHTQEAFEIALECSKFNF